MKLWVFSDLHLAFDGWERPDPVPEADLCVVAGDLMHNAGSSIRWLDQWIGQFKMPVLFVAGNHEFYGNSVMEGVEWARYHGEESKGVHFLENNTVVIGGVRFLGCTLWTDYEVEGDKELSMAVASMQLNDHRRIMWRTLPRPEAFTPQDALGVHERSRRWLTQELDKPFDGKTVVVTHHAPHPYSIHPRWEGQALNGAFVSDLSDLLAVNGPDLWVHGHVHDSFDYSVGRTRVVANPKGYADENPGFDLGLVVEV